MLVTKTQKIIQTGRFFKDQCDLISRSQKRKISDSGVLEHYLFWKCARHAAHAANLEPQELSRFVKPLSLMMSLTHLSHLNSRSYRNSKSIGQTIRHPLVHISRAEAVINATELTDVFEKYKDCVEIAELPVDFGSLLRDLDHFSFQPETAKAKWARHFFNLGQIYQ